MQVNNRGHQYGLNQLPEVYDRFSKQSSAQKMSKPSMDSDKNLVSKVQNDSTDMESPILRHNNQRKKKMIKRTFRDDGSGSKNYPPLKRYQAKKSVPFYKDSCEESS